ncbi:MAG TPA: EAL domain-containing protein [Longimicrobiaceae bacterium]|nr:EAL domain-containing protein [Longimicrobiaceae bacterium]
MTELNRFLIASYLAQAAGALLLAALLYAFHRHYARRYLLHWSLSWLGYVAYLAASAAALAVLGRYAAAHPVRLGITFAGALGGYLQIVWLLAGTYEVSRRTLVRRRVIVLMVPLAVGLAAVTAVAFLANPDAAPLRHFVRVGVRSLLVGLAFLVAAAGVWPAPDDEARFGRRLVAGGFFLFGVEQLQYFAFATLTLRGEQAPAYGNFLGGADLLLQWIIGLGMVMCLLEEERAAALRAARHAEHQAYHDALTALPNRRLLMDRLSLALQQARRDDERVGVVFLDLDHFKVVNDSLGHPTGDRLLCLVCERIRGAVRAGDTLARLGGDEFTLLLPRLKHADDAGRVARKVVDSLRGPYEVDGQELFVTASAGIAVAPDDGGDAETLIKHADIAMYRAKEAGRDGVAFFTPEMNERARERLELERALRRSVANQDFRLHYQPVLSVASGRVVAVEALLRWQHPERGLLLPDEFLELTEATGLITDLGRWALRTACEQARAWRDAGHTELAMLVNLSARQFLQNDVVSEVRQVLAATGVRPELLELEITESLAMRDDAATEASLRELKGLGVRISIDDFGTGYSSLAYLRRFPIDTLKIDRGFIDDVDADDGGATIASAIIAMGHRLGLRVIAEGVERTAQLDFLREQRCDAAQGFLFAHAAPAEELGGLLGMVAMPASALRT